MNYAVECLYRTGGYWTSIIVLADKLAAEQMASRLRRANVKNSQFIARVLRCNALAH